jgi:tetratricopeptide (TPR) repeat protein
LKARTLEERYSYLSAKSQERASLDDYKKAYPNYSPTKELTTHTLYTSSDNIVRVAARLKSADGSTRAVTYTLTREKAGWRIGWAYHWMAEGLAHFHAGEHRLAIQSWLQVLTVDPYSAEAFARLGLAHLITEELDDAKLDAKHAIEADPDCGDAYYLSGQLKTRLSDLDAAIADYRTATRLGTAFVAERPLADLLFKVKKAEEGRQVIRQRLTQDLGDPDALLLDLGVLWAAGEFEAVASTPAQLTADRLATYPEKVACGIRALIAFSKFNSAPPGKRMQDSNLAKEMVQLRQRCTGKSPLVDASNFDRAVTADAKGPQPETRDLASLESRLADRGYQRLLRCLENLDDGNKAFVVGGTDNPIASIRRYNEKSNADRYQLVRSAINRIAHQQGGRETWFVRKKMWEDWCTFDDVLAREISDF